VIFVLVFKIQIEEQCLDLFLNKCVLFVSLSGGFGMQQEVMVVEL
jgi:hypothetical protein